MRAHRALAAAAASITFFAVGAGGAFADVISNNVDASVDSTAESMPLNVGGADGSTVLRVIPANGDGKNGCNLTAGSTFVASVSSSDTAVATVSPSSITFTSCLDTKTLTVHPVATGSATISLATVSNSTGGSFDLGPATFAVTVAAPTNQAPTIAVTGVSMGGSYSYGAVPTAGCTVSDKEDGSPVVQPTLSAITGPDAAKGLGSQTATCSYTDNGGLTATSSATYTIIPAASVTTVTCSPTSLTYTGSPLTPCTATVTGSGGLNTTTPVTYGGTNTAAGTATATAPTWPAAARPPSRSTRPARRPR
jgi:hypothetical protein